MTQKTYGSLRQLQRLDEEIDRVQTRIAEFQPLLDEIEEPAKEMESELESTEDRLQELKLEEERLELAVEEKRNRLDKLNDRLNEVRNVREEAAVQAELDMVRRAVESDEQEALSLLDQIRKLELRLDEQREKLQGALDEVEPRRRELLEERSEAEARLDELEEERARLFESIDTDERQVYERIRSGGRDVAVAPLTADGACSNCYGMIPPQRQNELRHGADMIRCEACGVILAPPEKAGGDEDGE